MNLFFKTIVGLFIAIISVNQQAGAVTAVAMDAKQKTLVVKRPNYSSHITLELGKDEEPEGKPSYFGDDSFGIVLLPIMLDDAATTYVYAIDSKGKKQWFMDIKAFNASSPLIEKDAVYLAGMGSVFKVERQTGKIMWSHTDLFENKKYVFNGAEPIQRKDDIILFSQKVHVNDKTGKLVEVVP